MQSRVKLTLVVVVLWTNLLLLHSSTEASTDSGLPDFELDDGKDETDDEYYYVNDGSDQQMQPSHKIISYAKPPPPPGDGTIVPVQGDAVEPFLMEDDDTSFEVMDDVDFVETGSMDFQRKAERMKRIMLKAFANREFQRKFGEVLPLLKVMSKTQKSTLAALITAQVNSREGHTLSLEQVKSMFGNRPELILPLVYDIANMIRTVAKKESLLHDQQQHWERLEEADKALVEDEGVLSNHLLRRSFSIRSEPHGFRMKDVPPVTADLNDGRLMVDEQEPANVRTISTDASNEEAGRSARDEPQPFFEKLVQALPRFNVQQTTRGKHSDDRMTYHERKLNMTAFNATGTQRDQLAMASDGPIPVTLPKVSPKQSAGSSSGPVNAIGPLSREPTTTHGPEVISAVTEHKLTLEEIEDLAFAGLNGTEVDAYGASGTATHGNSTSSGGPVAEKLIGGRQRPQGLHTLQPSEKCEYFSGGVCIRVANYPTSEIMYSITRHRHAIGALLAEYIDKANAQDRTVYEPEEIAQGINTKLRKREDDPSKAGGSMCPSIIRYARPQKARSATGEWKYIVNTGEHTQTLRLEKCSTPQDSCTYLTDNFRSRCVQIYNYHRLLSWDAARGLHVDIFKVPTCCSCHIDGYRETFPPLTSYNDFKSKIHEDPSESASTLIRNTHHYSTLQFDQVDEDESDDNIAYQFSNGFQRVKPPKYESPLHLPAVPPPPPPPPGQGKTRFERPPKHPAISKPKHPHFIAPPTLDTYLSPPPNDLAYGIPFKRGPHYTTENALKRAGNVGAPNRRPLRKAANVQQHGDQSIAETDSRLNQVAVLPPTKLDQLPQTQAQNIIEKHRRRQQHTTPQPPLTTLQQQTPVIFRISQPAATSVGINPTVPLSTMPQPQPPSTASTSTTTVTSTNGHQRINYNYHPIIDFFEEEEEVPDITQEQIDRIGLNSHTSLNSWKPVITGRPRFH
ncbi:neurotrophin 1 [Anopheles maculipalpis]|uniref:neurotrophin 1 n=1 Tax=Anopheles maculipalpis TaxID=1496333 RepID=UPI0021590712|nr:neurotrophin 1 [Anopheles maculipalpis]